MALIYVYFHKIQYLKAAISFTQFGVFTSGPAHCESVPDVALESDGVAYDTVSPTQQQTSTRDPPSIPSSCFITSYMSE